MTEQNRDQGIVMQLPAHIESVRTMAPVSLQNQLLTWDKGPYWNPERGEVLPHHQAVFGAYSAFVERDTLGQITPDDLRHSETLLRWVTGLSPHPDVVLSQDPVRGKAMQTVFEYRLERLAEFEGEEAVKQMLSSYRTIIRSMVESKWMILPQVQTMDEKLGQLRNCTTAEQMTLLENRIRKNAQQLLEG